MSVTAECDSVTVTAPSVTNGVTLERDTLARARPPTEGCHGVTRDTWCVTHSSERDSDSRLEGGRSPSRGRCCAREGRFFWGNGTTRVVTAAPFNQPRNPTKGK